MSSTQKIGIGCLGVIVIGVLIILMVLGSAAGVWNTFNTNNQNVKASKSHYSAALNTCTPKIQMVWMATNDYYSHENRTQVGYAEARNSHEAYLKALGEFKKENAKKSPDSKQLTVLGTQVVNSALAFQVQIERTPDLKGIEATKDNIRNMQESIEEVKTALDDYIASMRTYNEYHGNLWPSIVGGFMPFPKSYEYYEGDIKKIDVNELNPTTKKT